MWAFSWFKCSRGVLKYVDYYSELGDNTYFWFWDYAQHIWVQQTGIKIWKPHHMKHIKKKTPENFTSFFIGLSLLTILWNPGMIMFWNYSGYKGRTVFVPSWLFLTLSNISSFLCCSHIQEQCVSSASPLQREPDVPIPACLWPGTVSHVSSMMFSAWFDHNSSSRNHRCALLY